MDISCMALFTLGSCRKMCGVVKCSVSENVNSNGDIQQVTWAIFAG